MRIHRSIAAAVTNRPPEKSRIRPNFLRGFIVEPQNIGIGMLSR